MSKKDEALKLALEALENSIDLVSQEARNAEELYGKYPTRLARIQGLVALEGAHEKAITALRDALAEQPAPMIRGDIRDGLVDDEPAQQEPFGYFRYDLRLDAWVQNRAGLTGTPFYTSPPAQRTWVWLTNVEIASACKKNGGSEWWWKDIEEFARAIEAKLKEKNT